MSILKNDKEVVCLIVNNKKISKRYINNKLVYQSRIKFNESIFPMTWTKVNNQRFICTTELGEWIIISSQPYNSSYTVQNVFDSDDSNQFRSPIITSETDEVYIEIDIPIFIKPICGIFCR